MTRLKLIVLAAIAAGVIAGCNSLCGVPVLGVFGTGCSPTATVVATPVPPAA